MVEITNFRLERIFQAMRALEFITWLINWLKSYSRKPLMSQYESNFLGAYFISLLWLSEFSMEIVIVFSKVDKFLSKRIFVQPPCTPHLQNVMELGRSLNVSKVSQLLKTLRFSIVSSISFTRLVFWVNHDLWIWWNVWEFLKSQRGKRFMAFWKLLNPVPTSWKSLFLYNGTMVLMKWSPDTEPNIHITEPLARVASGNFTSKGQ